MSEIQVLIEWISELLSEYLYFGVFLAALIETIIPPIPTMAVFPTAGFIASQNGLGIIEVVLLGIVGGFGASIPLIPFLFLDLVQANVLTCILSGIALMSVGGLISKSSGKNILWGAVRMLLIGSFAASITFVMGFLIGISIY